MLAKKLIEKIPDPPNAKQHYQSFIRNKNTKSVKQSEIITYQPKTFEDPNIFDIKPVITNIPVITEYPKISHNVSKIISHSGKVSSDSSLYSGTKKVKTF